MSQLHAKKRINQGSAISQTFTIYESLGSLGVWMLRVACEPASARLSLQAMRLSYFKNSDFAASLQININVVIVSQ